jgi:5'-deoxynucleotidase YfbR-like HD superfamily hydrolase
MICQARKFYQSKKKKSIIPNMTEQAPKRDRICDYRPQTPGAEQFYDKADKVYTFMGKMYQAYGRMRFRDSPYMNEPPPELSEPGTESIADHMWSVNLLWMSTQPIMPHVAAAVSVDEVSSFLTMHDIGEIGDGDISAYRQINGDGMNRREQEFIIFNALTAVLPEESQQLLNTLHDRYEQEKNDPQTTDKEVLLAKIFDTLQGDHFVLTQHDDFSIEPEAHVRIVTQKLLPYATRLRELFLEEKNYDAAQEITLLMSHHLHQYQKKAVAIPSDFLLCL